MQPVEDAPGYRVLDEAGRGGFAVVYRAYQERLDRVVALKVLSVDRVDQRTLRRFQRELQLTGRLTGHPNVVTVFDTGTTRSGKPYIAMDFFENGSLRDRVRNEGPLPLADVLRAGVKLAGALAAVHEAGVLHGDIKPQNILISRYGEPAVADFGVARVVDSSEVTASAQAFTPLHAAPEVLSGQPHTASTDIYSLGSTLYHLLAGQPAFHSPTDPSIAPLMFRVLSNEPPPIARADVPAVAVAAILRAMAKKPHERYGTARSFAQRLQEVQGELGLPITDLIGADPMPGSSTVPRTSAPSPTPAPANDSPYAPRPAPHREPAARQESTPATDSPYAPPTQPSPAQRSGPLSAGPPSGFGMTPPAPAREEANRWSSLPEAGPLSARSAGPLSAGARPQGDPPASTAGAQPRTHPSARPGVEAVAAQWAQPPAQAPRAEYPVPPAVPRASALGRAAAGSGRTSGARTRVIVGLVVGAVVLAGAGVAVWMSRQQATIARPQPTPSKVQQSATPQQIDQAAIDALKPRKVKVVADNGRTVTLRWVLPADAKRYPVVLQREPFEDTSQRITALKAGSTSTRVLALDPEVGYCFVVGVALRISEASTIAWSEPACIRGAVATTG